jgi:2-succinyl-5-enolpyruvyl-6-hydroxy-3-cyclohexene-1-carboxylate synthase
MEQQTTDKEVVRILIAVCLRHGVENVVISPGSRNAPLIIGFNREQAINCRVIIDERSAAYFALGMAQKSKKPVVLVCTSGTALLNYAPAVAEAYYQRLPLIIVSADRPEEWIDQQDSQTIRQAGALRNFVKKSYQLSDDIYEEDKRWFINRSINEAFITALSGRMSPVHINISLNEPLCSLSENGSSEERIIKSVEPELLDDKTLCDLAGIFNKSHNVMIVAGFMPPSCALKHVINKLTDFSSVAVVAELISNITSEQVITASELVFSAIRKNEKENFAPDLLISFGGSLVSKSVKQFLRENQAIHHWHIGKEENLIDTFRSLTNNINVHPEIFFKQIIPLLNPPKSSYQSRLLQKESDVLSLQKKRLETIEWCEEEIFSCLMAAIPPETDLQISNGLNIRMAQQFKLDPSVSVYSNRGTSGIDGSTSTAVGSAFLNNNVTTFISGDLSFLYDSNGLWNNYLSPRLKMIVINNGGGGIFRSLGGMSTLPERNNYFETPHGLDFNKLAELYQIDFFKAVDKSSLQMALKKIYERNDRPVILEIVV